MRCTLDGIWLALQIHLGLFYLFLASPYGVEQNMTPVAVHPRAAVLCLKTDAASIKISFSFTAAAVL